MPGQVRVTFQQGDSVTAPEFRERLVIVANQAADGVSWTWGPGLVGNYSPGSGFTLALDGAVFPEVYRESFTAMITSNSGLAHAWTERARKDATTWENKADSPRSGTTSDQPAYPINGIACAADTQVVLWKVRDSSGTIRYEFVSPEYFKVKIEKDLGSQGTSSSPAGWTYKVRTMLWNGTSGGTLLGSNVALARPRPNGAMTYQSGSTGIGWAFYDGSTLKLWDAGEVESTNTECT